MKASDVLSGALDILDDESKWCQGALAVTGPFDITEGGVRMVSYVGGECPHYSPYARRWCLDGALLKASECITLAGENDPNINARTMAYALIERRLADYEPPFHRWKGVAKNFVEFNDDEHTTFEDVRLLLKQTYEDALEANV